MDHHAIYEGQVHHQRLRPAKHKFTYRVFSLLVDIDHLDELDTKLRWFSRNRFNLFAFYDRDHGADKPANISHWIRAHLKTADLPTDGKIQLLFYPRMLGYAFNPISVYYCHDSAGQLAAILYAVRNTFGGRHAYLISVTGGEVEGDVHQQADKIFHVSPFIAMEMRYDFILNAPGEDRLRVAINVGDEAGVLLTTSFAGDHRPLTDQALWRLFFGYPMMVLKIITAIYWQAVRLLLKGVGIKKGARDPAMAVTIIRR